MYQTKSISEVVVQLFDDHPEQFRRHLVDQGHAESTLKDYARCVAQLAVAMKAHGVPLAALDEAQAVALILKVNGNRKTGALNERGQPPSRRCRARPRRSRGRN